jgi:RNA recognition motif-containing protein
MTPYPLTKLSEYARLALRELNDRLVVFVFSINDFSRFFIDRFLSETFLSMSFSFWKKSMSIYVGNLSYDVTDADLTQVFAEYGSVKRVQLPTDRETGRMRGFAFVEMSQEAEEDAAIEALDGAEWMGRDLKVNKAKPRENRGGSSGGGRNNRDGFSRGY